MESKGGYVGNTLLVSLAIKEEKHTKNKKPTLPEEEVEPEVNADSFKQWQDDARKQLMKVNYTVVGLVLVDLNGQVG